MSVLIKGLKMPYGCWECPVAEDHVYCKVLGKKTSADNERHIDCPMMELPEDDVCCAIENATVVIPAERSEDE